MRYRCKIHNFLYGRFAEHAGTCLTTCIDVRVITEDRKCVGSKRTCRNMKDTRELLAGYLVDIRDHKKKSLGSSVSRCHSACSKRAVERTSSACLGLHLGDLYFSPEDVLSSCRSPFIDMLRHDR